MARDCVTLFGDDGSRYVAHTPMEVLPVLVINLLNLISGTANDARPTDPTARRARASSSEFSALANCNFPPSLWS